MKTFYVEIHTLSRPKNPKALRLYELLNELKELRPVEKKTIFAEHHYNNDMEWPPGCPQPSYTFRGDIIEATFADETQPKADLILFCLGEQTDTEDKWRHAKEYVEYMIGDIGGNVHYISINDDQDVMVLIEGCDVSLHQMFFIDRSDRTIH